MLRLLDEERAADLVRHAQRLADARASHARAAEARAEAGRAVERLVGLVGIESRVAKYGVPRAAERVVDELQARVEAVGGLEVGLGGRDLDWRPLLRRGCLDLELLKDAHRLRAQPALRALRDRHERLDAARMLDRVARRLVLRQVVERRRRVAAGLRVVAGEQLEQRRQGPRAGDGGLVLGLGRQAPEGARRVLLAVGATGAQQLDEGGDAAVAHDLVLVGPLVARQVGKQRRHRLLRLDGIGPAEQRHERRDSPGAEDHLLVARHRHQAPERTAGVVGRDEPLGREQADQERDAVRVGDQLLRSGARRQVHERPGGARLGLDARRAQHHHERLHAPRRDDGLLVLRRAREVGEGRRRAHLRLVDVAPVAEQPHERGDGARLRDRRAVGDGARREHGERLGRLHLRRRVTHVEQRDERLHDGVAVLGVGRRDVEERALGVLLRLAVGAAQQRHQRRDGAGALE